MAFLSMPSKACLLVFKWGVEGWGNYNQVKQVGVARSRGGWEECSRQIEKQAQRPGAMECHLAKSEPSPPVLGGLWKGRAGRSAVEKSWKGLRE